MFQTTFLHDVAGPVYLSNIQKVDTKIVSKNKKELACSLD